MPAKRDPYAQQLTQTRRQFNAEMDLMMKQQEDKKKQFAEDTTKNAHIAESMYAILLRVYVGWRAACVCVHTCVCLFRGALLYG